MGVPAALGLFCAPGPTLPAGFPPSLIKGVKDGVKAPLLAEGPEGQRPIYVALTGSGAASWGDPAPLPLGTASLTEDGVQPPSHGALNNDPPDSCPREPQKVPDTNRIVSPRFLC